MILDEKSLQEWEESAFTSFKAEQRKIILERFGSEPGPNVWSEQDIVEQIRKICQEHPAPKPKAISI
jgi:hypothetical protein